MSALERASRSGGVTDIGAHRRVCSDGICVCTEADGNCQKDTDCCSGVCSAGECAACNPSGSLCEIHANCCEGYCDNGICKSPDVCVNFCNKNNDPKCGGPPNDGCVEGCKDLLLESGACSSEMEEYISCVAWKATVACGEYGAEPVGCGEESFAALLCESSPAIECDPVMPPPSDDVSCDSYTFADGTCRQHCSSFGGQHWTSTCFDGRCICEFDVDHEENNEVYCEVQSDACSCFGLQQGAGLSGCRGGFQTRPFYCLRLEGSLDRRPLTGQAEAAACFVAGSSEPQWGPVGPCRFRVCLQ